MRMFPVIIELLQAYAESPILSPPASAAEISEVEGIVKQQLPDDVRAAYHLGNGEAELVERTGFERDPDIFSGKSFHSTQKVIYEYQAWKELLDSGDLGDGVCQGSCRLKLKIMPPCFPLFQSYLYPG